MIARLKIKMKQKKDTHDKGEIMKNEISTRGRSFQGEVIRKIGTRVAIEFEKSLFLRKYERYEKRKTRLNAKIPKTMTELISVGDYIEIKECRPLSKSIHFVVTKKIKGSENESNNVANN
jgi:small subunit ribosomal protein S17